ncbi:MAG: haloacid dehalogenase [Anaerolineaceae bacterium]|nr:haloacid dehalogenase [Anaerolineaceae bacterium]
MEKLNQIIEKIRLDFDERTQIRDHALIQARKLTRNSANAIRAIHRNEKETALEELKEAKDRVSDLHQKLEGFPDLYFTGYTQDAIKEYVEASVVIAFLSDEALPTPEYLGVEYDTFLRGLAEVPGELRRRCMDIMRLGYSEDAEQLLSYMDDIYAVLVTMDYPDAITHGLRRQTDMVRGILERTRGDLTISLREEKLKKSLDDLITHMQDGE